MCLHDSGVFIFMLRMQVVCVRVLYASYLHDDIIYHFIASACTGITFNDIIHRKHLGDAYWQQIFGCVWLDQNYTLLILDRST